MAYTGTIVTENEMTFMAGELVDATGNVEANHNFLAAEAEAYLCDLVQYDIVANWASLTAAYKAIFTEWAARYAACQLIMYNTAAYSNGLIEAEDMVTFHTWRMQEIQELLEKKEVQDFLGV